MTFALANSGSKTATVPSTATFTNTSANIGLTNTCAAGDIVSFTTSSALPTNFAVNTNYFVIATGLSSSNIQVSATPGGSAITAGSAGAGTQTATVEHVVDVETTNGSYEFAADTINLVLGEVAELAMWEAIDGTNLRKCWKAGVQLSQTPGKKSMSFPVITSAWFTIKQLSGTGRAFPWRVIRI